jgi:hypothetical protein
MSYSLANKGKEIYGAFFVARLACGCNQGQRRAGGPVNSRLTIN